MYLAGVSKTSEVSLKEMSGDELHLLIIPPFTYCFLGVDVQMSSLVSIWSRFWTELKFAAFWCFNWSPENRLGLHLSKGLFEGPATARSGAAI